MMEVMCNGSQIASNCYLFSFSPMFVGIKLILKWRCCLFTTIKINEIRFWFYEHSSLYFWLSYSRSRKTYDGSRRNPCLSFWLVPDDITIGSALFETEATYLWGKVSLFELRITRFRSYFFAFLMCASCFKRNLHLEKCCFKSKVSHGLITHFMLKKKK